MKLSTLPEQFQSDHIQYALEVEQVLSNLESNLHNSDDPEEIITKMLVAAVTFYDGDWAGIMEADLTMKVWSTLWWYNRKTGGMTPNSFGDLQEGEYLVRWIDALMNGTPMVIHDIEEIAESSPLEYAFMKQNNVQSIIAVPFWKRPTGFLIIRNPHRYLNRSSLLQMMAFVAVSSVNEKRLMDSTKLKLIPSAIQKDTDVIVNIFDELQIITSKGVLMEKDLKSPKMSRFIVYLLFHSDRPAPPFEIVSDLWPEDDLSKAGTQIKNLAYRLQQMFGLISDYRLVESTTRGYQINPKLNIITDCDCFEKLWNESQGTVDLRAKRNILTKAIDLYKHGPMPVYCGEHWFMPTVTYYSLRYINVVNQLLLTLDKSGDYSCILEYANIAVSALPGTSDIYYWLIYSMNRLGMVEVARNELKAAKQILSELDYQDLLMKLDLTE